VDLFTKERPRTCLNFLKLCKTKAYNMNLFHTIQSDFIAQTGDPSGTGKGGESIFCQMYGPQARYFEAETVPRIKHTKPGLISMVNCGENVLGSQFFVTLGEELDYLDGEHCVFGEVVEGEELLTKLNNSITDDDGRPYQDIRITHTVVLHDPYDDPPGLELRENSPEPTEEMLANSRIGADENINDYEGKTEEEVNEIIADKEAKARATILEMVGDIPDADIAPPENVLFVCKLNPVTCDDDLEIIFSRFGQVVSCEVIRDRVTGDSLQYAFVEFADRTACEQAYFKMDNVLIDDRRIHVDFSQSVSKYRWKGKGRLEIVDEKKEQKKSVDLKDLINKERAEIKSKGDGKIERNSDNLVGKERESKYKNGHSRERNERPGVKDKDKRYVRDDRRSRSRSKDRRDKKYSERKEDSRDRKEGGYVERGHGRYRERSIDSRDDRSQRSRESNRYGEKRRERSPDRKEREYKREKYESNSSEKYKDLDRYSRDRYEDKAKRKKSRHSDSDSPQESRMKSSRRRGRSSS